MDADRKLPPQGDTVIDRGGWAEVVDVDDLDPPPPAGRGHPLPSPGPQPVVPVLRPEERPPRPSGDRWRKLYEDWQELIHVGAVLLAVLLGYAAYRTFSVERPPPPVRTGAPTPASAAQEYPTMVSPQVSPPAPTTPQGGLVVITSRPAGAEAFLNGQHLGATPLVVRRPLPDGGAIVRLEKPGYRRWEEPVVVRQGNITANVTLEPATGAARRE